MQSGNRDNYLYPEFRKSIEGLEDSHIGNLDDYKVFEEVHGCNYAHGQYGTYEDGRGTMLKLYMEDNYPKREYDCAFSGTSIVFIAIK